MANEIAQGIAELGATCVRLYGELATAEARAIAGLETARQSVALTEKALALLARVEVDRDEAQAQANQSAEAAEAAQAECDAMRLLLSELVIATSACMPGGATDIARHRAIEALAHPDDEDDLAREVTT